MKGVAATIAVATLRAGRPDSEGPLFGMTSSPATVASLQAAIVALEAQRALLGDAVVDVAVAALRAQSPALREGGSTNESGQLLRLVSILFLDVVDSTALAQRLDPEEVNVLMDGALHRFTGTVQRHGGRVLQYAGDSLLAAFGADEVREDDAVRAVRCGLALLGDGRGVRVEVRDLHGHDSFDVRVGIHSGNVLLRGGVDAEGTVRGHAVNVAARVEQSAPSGALLISVDTYRLVQGLFDVQEARAVRVKGIDAPVVTYRVDLERTLGAGRVQRGLEGVASELVGRSDELSAMHSAASDAQARQTLQAITLMGDAGLGKTRLLAEFEAHMPAGTEVFRAFGNAAGQHQPYGVIRDMLFRRFDIQDGDSLSIAKSKLADGLSAVFSERAEEQTALLGQLIGLDYGDSPFIAGILQDGRQLRARALHAWAEHFRRLFEGRPEIPLVVLLLDDLHWADDGSLDAIDGLVRAVEDVPIVLVCVARPDLLESRPDWGGSWPAQRRVDLLPLGARDQRALSGSLLRHLEQGPAAEKLGRLLVERGDGNPFYMEALLQMLIDRGVVLTAARPWCLAAEGLDERQVPATLIGVLQARLDALVLPQRRALQQASVVGSVFWDDALAALDAASPPEIEALRQRTLVLQREQSAFSDAEEFAFRHHLLHEVTYGTVLKRDKREQHRRAALWLEARSAGRDAEFAGLIAEHFERGGDGDRASAYWAMAAKQASIRHADSAALIYVDRALLHDRGDDAERRLSLLRTRSNVWSRRGDVGEHLRALVALESFAEEQGNSTMRLIAAQSRMYRQCQDGEYEKAEMLGKESLVAVGEDAPAEAGRTHNILIMALGRQGKHAEARRHAQIALELSRASHDVYTEASVLNNLSVGDLAEGRMADAVVRGTEALVLYRRIGSRYGAAIAMLNLARIASRRGRLGEARDQLVELLALCDEIDHQPIGAQARSNLSSVLSELGEEPGEALRHARDGVAMATRLGDRYIEDWGAAAICEALCGLGRWQEAIEHGQRASEGLANHGEHADARVAEGVTWYARQQAGEHAEALSGAVAMLESAASRGGWETDDARAAWFYGRVLVLHQDARAADAFAAARAILQRQAAQFDDPDERQVFLHGAAWKRDLQSG